MKQIRITHYNLDGSETTVPISGKNMSELNNNVNSFMKRAGWDKRFTDVTGEFDENSGKW